MAVKDLTQAKSIAFLLLKFRNRSKFEIADRLKRKSFSREIISQTVDFLERLNYLNDAEFAYSWTVSRLAKPLGLKRIFFELEQKGIAKPVIEQTLEKLKKGYLELETVEKIAKDKFKKMKSLDEYKAKRRLFGYLMRRGFNPETIKEVVDSL